MEARHPWGDYLYIFGTIALTVYGQMVVKWQVGLAGAMPADPVEKLRFLAGLVLRPWVLSSIAAAFLAFLCWVGAMAKFDLSYAYPFTSLAFVLVMVLSTAAFGEALTWPKVAGVCLIVAGIAIGSRS